MLRAQFSKCSRSSLLPAEMQKTSNSWVICSSLVTRKEPRHLPWTGLLGPHEAYPSSQRTHVCSEVPENAMCITGTTTPACIRKQKKRGEKKSLPRLQPAELQQMACCKSGEGGERSLHSYERLPPLLSLLLPHLLPHTPPLQWREKYAGKMLVKSHTRCYLTDSSELLSSYPIYPNFASKPWPTESRLGGLVSVQIP